MCKCYNRKQELRRTEAHCASRVTTSGGRHRVLPDAHLLRLTGGREGGRTKDDKRTDWGMVWSETIYYQGRKARRVSKPELLHPNRKTPTKENKISHNHDSFYVHYYYYYYYYYYPILLLSSSSSGSQKSTGLTDRAFLIHCSAKNFVNVLLACIMHQLLFSALKYIQHGGDQRSYKFLFNLFGIISV
jgi:hypothetical protein